MSKQNEVEGNQTEERIEVEEVQHVVRKTEKKKRGFGHKLLEGIKCFGSLALIIIVIMTFTTKDDTNSIPTAEEYNERFEVIGQYTDENLETNPVVINKMVYNNDVKNPSLDVYFTNNSEETVKNTTFGYVAWDKDKKPVTLSWNKVDDETAGYAYALNCEEVLKPGESNIVRFELLKECADKIEYIKSFVVFYNNIDGEAWNNPKNEWVNDKYVGQDLSDDTISNVSANGRLIVR